jgi:hypothetical protein
MIVPNTVIRHYLHYYRYLYLYTTAYTVVRTNATLNLDDETVRVRNRFRKIKGKRGTYCTISVKQCSISGRAL